MPEFNEPPGKKKFSQLFQQKINGVPLNRQYSQETADAFIDPRRFETPPEEPVVVQAAPEPAAADLENQGGLLDHLYGAHELTFRDIAKSVVNAKNNTGHIITTVRLPWQILALSTDLAHEYRVSRTQIIKYLLEYALIETGYTGEKREAVLKKVAGFVEEEKQALKS